VQRTFQRISHRSPYAYLIMPREEWTKPVNSVEEGPWIVAENTVRAPRNAPDADERTRAELKGFDGFEPLHQMPPAATKVVDDAAVGSVGQWIAGLGDDDANAGH
jgi:hypothetical protein